ncbi:MAG: CRISPR-associated protein Csy1 [Motiliproteus sp.]
MDVGKLLQLDEGDKTLIEHIREGDDSPLQPFAESSEQLQSWVQGFQQALEGKEISSHALSKQLFYPVGDGQYHLLAPLFSSSLAQSIHQRVTASRYSDEAKKARDARRKERYVDTPVVYYPNIAVQHFGGTQSQNISQLNAVRMGGAFLLSCAPPRWQSQTRPPLQIKNIIDGPYRYRVRRLTWELKEYLLSQVGKSSTQTVRQQRAERIDQLIDELILLGAEIQTLDVPAGWSAADDCQLPLHQRLWLDPRRAAQDEDFAQARDKKDWIEQVARDFSIWLNRQLAHDKLALGGVEHREWKHLMAQKLRLLKDDLEGVAL